MSGRRKRPHRLTAVGDNNKNLRVGACRWHVILNEKWGRDLQLDKPRELALEGLLKACETMFMLTLEPKGDYVEFDPTSMKFGGRISVIRDDGVWDLALFGCENGCKSLTRAIYVMEPDEEPTAEEVVAGVSSTFLL